MVFRGPYSLSGCKPTRTCFFILLMASLVHVWTSGCPFSFNTDSFLRFYSLYYFQYSNTLSPIITLEQFRSSSVWNYTYLKSRPSGKAGLPGRRTSLNIKKHAVQCSFASLSHKKNATNFYTLFDIKRAMYCHPLWYVLYSPHSWIAQHTISIFFNSSNFTCFCLSSLFPYPLFGYWHH